MIQKANSNWSNGLICCNGRLKCETTLNKQSAITPLMTKVVANTVL